VEKFNRAERRHQRARLKHKRKNYWGYPRNPHSALNKAPERPVGMGARDLGSVVQHPQSCSCSGCGNPRHNEWEPLDLRLTMAERRFNINYREQLTECDFVDGE